VKGKKKEIILGALLVAIAFASGTISARRDAARTAGPARPGAVARVKIDDIRLPNVNWAALSARARVRPERPEHLHLGSSSRLRLHR